MTNHKIKKARLLLSLEMAALGNSGIPQDTRLLFKALSQSQDFDVSGLLMENQGTHTRQIGPTGRRIRRDREVLDASQYLLALSGLKPERAQSRFERIQAYFKATTLSSRLGIYRPRLVPNDVFTATIWRQLFQKSLSSADRQSISERPIYYTHLTLNDLMRAAWPPFIRLDTSGFDAVVFQDARPIKVSPGTRKFIRYHDAIPLTEPDLLGDGAYTGVHYAFLQACRSDSHFVCNSDATRASLCSLFPDLEPHSTVIPCAIESGVLSEAHAIRVSQIVQTRLSLKALGPAPESQHFKMQVLENAQLEQPWRYVLAISAIEPKKNIATLVHAWERLRAAHDERLRLIIVGKASWSPEASFQSMRPHIASGDLLHLEDLPLVEVQALLLNAEALVFPSYAEGFGYPPVEALCAGLAPVVSDLPALRETLGEAAIYVDPYDVQNVADGMAQLVFGEGRERRRKALVAAGRQRIADYSLERVAERWNMLMAEPERPRSRFGSGKRLG